MQSARSRALGLTSPPLGAASAFWAGRRAFRCAARCCRSASSSGSRSRPAGKPRRSGLPAARRRTAGQHRPAVNLTVPITIVLSVCAGLADRAQRPAGRAALVLARGGAAGDPGLRAQLCLDQHWCRAARPVGPACWSRFSPISRFSICRCGAVAPSRPGNGGRRRVTWPWALARVQARRAAAIAARHLRRLAAGRPASAGRIRPLSSMIRFDTFHHGDRRPVPVDL
jgi:hypothetical protein